MSKRRGSSLEGMVKRIEAGDIVLRVLLGLWALVDHSAADLGVLYVAENESGVLHGGLGDAQSRAMG